MSGRVTIAPEKAYRLINHGPCPLVTTGDGTRRNVAPINWTVPVEFDPPRVLCAMGQGSLTEEMVRTTGEWVLNLVSEEKAAALVHCGKRSGRQGDKFASSGLTPVPCAIVKPPRLAEAFAHLELKLDKSIPYGEVTLHIGSIVHAEADPEFIDDGHLRPEKARTLHHLGSGRFAVADRLLVVPKESL